MPSGPIRNLPIGAWVGLLLTLLVLVSGNSIPVATASVTAAHSKRPYWNELGPANNPGARQWTSAAYDPALNYTVLYGGYNPSLFNPFFWSTWEWSGSNWINITPNLHPPDPTGMQLVYDPALHGVLTFGGEAPYGTSYSNQTWLFSKGNWTNISTPVSPSPRSQYAMAYDSHDSEMVLFGGTNGSSTPLSDTWVFNGSSWSKVVTRHHPPGREFARMVYDRQSNQTLLVGGTDPTNIYELGTWAFEAGSWKLLPNVYKTPVRMFEYLSTLGNGTPIMFGGQAPGSSTTYFNDTFVFYHLAWHRLLLNAKITARSSPTPRANGAMTYDAHDGYVFTYGGRESTGQFSSDDWTIT